MATATHNGNRTRNRKSNALVRFQFLVRSIIGQIDVYVRLGTGDRAYVGKDYAIDSVRVHVAQQQQETVTETETDTETDATRTRAKRH